MDRLSQYAKRIGGEMASLRGFVAQQPLSIVMQAKAAGVIPAEIS
jgi:hypothetical protein